MKLTIIRLENLTSQDRADLQKIWPQCDPAELQQQLANQQLYVARFNDRLLAAVWLKLAAGEGEFSDLCVREVTRRRGVGKYLIDAAIASNPAVSYWKIAEEHGADATVVAGFMQACEFRREPNGWSRVQIYQMPV